MQPNTSKYKEALRLHQSGEVDQAEVLYEEILQRDPGHADSLHFLGVIKIQKQAFGEALDLIERAIRIKPDGPVYHHNLGAVLRVLGRFSEAEQHYREAIRLRPEYAEAYFNLSAVKRFSVDDPVISAMTDQLRRTDLSIDDQCFLHFAAVKIYDDLGAFDKAFVHYHDANKARQACFDPDKRDAFVSDLLTTFTAELLSARSSEGCDSPLPIFIVGFPRSGTTLVEQILASHPKVFGVGELPDIPSIANTLPRHVPGNGSYPTCAPHLAPDAFRGFGEAYLRRTRQINATAERIVDKMPTNYLLVGLIRLLLPSARVIHCRRNALDTCLSCYFQRFRTGHEFSYELRHLGSCYQNYERLMAYWCHVLSDHILELDYETLTDELEPSARNLLAFFGLEWDDRCLEFHRTQREVATASNWQVRRPVYRSSVGRWRNYETHLGPLRQALGR